MVRLAELAGALRDPPRNPALLERSVALGRRLVGVGAFLKLAPDTGEHDNDREQARPGESPHAAVSGRPPHGWRNQHAPEQRP
jgi:hypothetical protein